MNFERVVMSMLPYTNRLNGYFNKNDSFASGDMGLMFGSLIKEDAVNDTSNVFFEKISTSAFIMCGYLEIILSREISSDEQQKYLEKIYKEFFKLNHILDDFSKL
jgi:hypothetical protein